MELVKTHGGTAIYSGRKKTVFITGMDANKAVRFHREWDSTHPGVSLPFQVVFQAERHTRYKSKGRVKHGTGSSKATLPLQKS
jgi:hypothetical protein